MDNEDLDALAAEYVLGTLAPDERSRAEALIAVDPGFVEIVHQWERRLGELNVMVEAVEPPAEIWDKIRSDIAPVAPGDEVHLAPTEPAPLVPAKAETETKAETATKANSMGAGSAPLAALAATLSSSEGQPEPGAEARSGGKPETQSSGAGVLLSPTIPPLPQTESSAKAVDFHRRIRRWRGVAIAAGLVAAALAAFIVVSQVDPALIPPGGFRIPQLVARGAPPPPPAAAPPPASRLVAVLQQAPFAPAFLLAIDTAGKTLTVRRVAAKAEAGHSYELWLIPPKSRTPQALGIVGEQEFTQPKLPANFDLAAARAATYAVSFEPAGGSKTGAPTGPILFTGKPIESIAPPPPPPAKPKT